MPPLMFYYFNLSPVSKQTTYSEELTKTSLKTKCKLQIVSLPALAQKASKDFFIWKPHLNIATEKANFLAS